MISLIPWQLRENMRSWLEMSQSRELRNVRSRLLRSLDLKVGFGGVLDDGRPVHGGAVKLLALRESLPYDEQKFSVLYSVSSSIPQCAEALFKLCRERGIKIIWNQNGVGYPAWAGRESERFNRPMRRLREKADFVIYQSQFCQESAQHFLGPCEIPSEILFNPVDVEKFQPSSFLISRDRAIKYLQNYPPVLQSETYSRLNQDHDNFSHILTYHYIDWLR
jgi:glycosyltransferase involved in cell wall biosynthesis